MKNPLIILGSSRSNGATMKAIQLVTQDYQIPLVDLNALSISYYDYDHKNQGDDFIPLAERMVQHDSLILATPVYWYTMSAIMKTFLDRWSDLLKTRKDLGRALRGKTIFVITSYYTSLPQGFEDAFWQTCDYMDMCYGGCYYYYNGPDEELANLNETKARDFALKVFSNDLTQNQHSA